jgi:lysine-ketoglutarate reductase/saccharopine dehydrogenase-like protein (TIGR00300 family)
MRPTKSPMHTEVVELRGHIIDSLILPKVLDEIIEAGAEYTIVDFQIGTAHEDPSFARLEIRGSREVLDRLLGELANLGAVPPEQRDARFSPVDLDGTFPEDFYSTTNLPTEVRVDGTWLAIENPEMDCGITVRDGHARTIAMSDARVGDPIVCGHDGIKVFPVEKPRAGDTQVFTFMSSEVSSEKPQGLMIDRIAKLAREVKERGAKLLWVLGPAVVHTGSAEAFCALVRSGWVDVVFAGNALATHDCEGSIYGTSLGVSLSEGVATEHGHEHHIRAINLVRRAGSFKAAVDSGLITSGIMYHLVTHHVDYVLGGSVRDDGPMPEVITDVIETQRAMRARVPGLGLAIMVSTMLHSIATGNILPGSVPIVCVDINPAAVTKLIDRGSTQSVGMVTDVGLFIRHLADSLGAT